MSHRYIVEENVALKTAALWERKAAKFHVEAQEHQQKGNAPVLSEYGDEMEYVNGGGTVTHADEAKRYLGLARHAERTALEWYDKAAAAREAYEDLSFAPDPLT